MKKREFLIEKIQSLGKQILPQGSSLWLYGSQARGTSNADSDWDVLILLDKEKKENSDFDNYCYPLMQMGFEYDELINPQVYTCSDWRKYSFTPFVHNVEADKLVLI